MQGFEKPVIPKTPPTLFPRFISLLLVSCSVCILYLLVALNINRSPYFLITFQNDAASDSPLTLDGIVFGLASHRKTWYKRKHYLRQWWRPQGMRGCAFLDKPSEENDTLLPPTCQSGDLSRFHYTHPPDPLNPDPMHHIHIARVVVETVNLNHTNVRWFMFGDDDTVFFPENLVKVLSKYDDRLWYYVGSSSEVYAQNRAFGLGMAFGGGGIAISYPLAKVLAKGYDECIERYSDLYGADGRVYACMADLGVELTREPGFHQLDVTGDAFGLLAAHPLAPLVSLHHIDYMDPIFPNMTRAGALQHLFTAANIDSQRLLQQTICHAHSSPWTISVSWGYAVQIFPTYVRVPEVLRVQQSFGRWTEGDVLTTSYMFDTREHHPDPCERPVVFFMENTTGHDDLIESNYTKAHYNCPYDKTSPRKLDKVRVLSHKLDLDIKQLKAPRRHCCDVLDPSAGNIMEIAIRECREEESVFSHTMTTPVRGKKRIGRKARIKHHRQ